MWASNPSVRTCVGQVVYDCELQGCRKVMLGSVLREMVLALAVVCYAAVYEISSSIHV